MTGGAGGVPTGPPVIVLNGIDVASINHFFPEHSGTLSCVNPDVFVGESLSDIGNHSCAMTLAPVDGTKDNHIVDFNPIIVHENRASADGYSPNIIPSITIVLNRFESAYTVEGGRGTAAYFRADFIHYL